ncbi:spore coat associated protein CotJA [Polycladospora coralii]|uniref:spore coat associated protein CotJA n=1 Tax=Polycladospora coralii TaxID=2771432 RepID=UPI00321FBEFB
MTQSPQPGAKPPNPYLDQIRYWYPYASPYDPCPPIYRRSYIVAPNQYVGFQPPHLPQYSPKQALRYGTLWPIFYSPYDQASGKGGD